MILLGLIIFLVLYIETKKRIETFIKHKRLKKSMSEMKLTNPNETLMLTFGMGVVMAWVVIAATASYFSIVEQRDISDSQLTVIGLLGGPALLIITSVLDLFKGKESAKIAVLPDRLSADVQATDAEKTHVRLLEEYKMKHDLEMEKMQKQHTLDMEAYQITNKKVK
jgi:Na+/melibiose symporter-like transporter